MEKIVGVKKISATEEQCADSEATSAADATLVLGQFSPPVDKRGKQGAGRPSRQEQKWWDTSQSKSITCKGHLARDTSGRLTVRWVPPEYISSPSLPFSP